MRAISHHQGLLFVLPALLFVTLFVFVPLGQLFYMSFTNASLLGGSEWVGLGNYQTAFKDKQFWTALWFTLRYTLFITPAVLGIGLGLALLTVPNKPVQQFTRAVIFMPVVIGLGSSSLLWIWLFNQQVGLFNRLLVDLHVLAEPAVWFTRVDSGITAVVISVTWKVVGFGMLLFIAGIQAIDREINEASLIDGANYLQTLWHITLPLISRVILLTALLSIIGGMLAFEQFYIMTGGNPRGQTFTTVYWIYQSSFISFKLGYGAAQSVILTGIILVFTSIQMAISNRAKPA